MVIQVGGRDIGVAFDPGSKAPGGYFAASDCDPELLSPTTRDCPSVFMWLRENGDVFWSFQGTYDALPDAPWTEDPVASLLADGARMTVLEVFLRNGIPLTDAMRLNPGGVMMVAGKGAPAPIATTFEIFSNSEVRVFSTTLRVDGTLTDCKAPTLTANPIECPPTIVNWPENEEAGRITRVVFPIPLRVQDLGGEFRVHMDPATYKAVDHANTY